MPGVSKCATRAGGPERRFTDQREAVAPRQLIRCIVYRFLSQPEFRAAEEKMDASEARFWGIHPVVGTHTILLTPLGAAL